MGNLTNNLSRHEVACRCGCGFDTTDFKLVQIIQDCCDHFAAKYHQRIVLDPTGPNRCVAHNKAEGGAPDSQHIYGKAMDFVISLKDGMLITPQEIYDYLDNKYPDSLGLGIYDDRNHADSRDVKARWDNRT